MRRILIIVQYIGTNYNGFQKQPDPKLKTVEGMLNIAFKEVFREDVKLIASGRLDAGVSAAMLPIHFDTENKIPLWKVKGAINRFLPKDIRVFKTEEVDENFHARFSVKQKTYRYSMYVSPDEMPFLEHDHYRLNTMPDVDLMKEASKYLIGQHDFSAFMSKKSSIKTTVRNISNIEIIKNNTGIYLNITGNGFLYNMVRIIMGTLLDVGYGKIKPVKVQEILESKARKNAGKKAPGHALMLLSVEY